MISSSFFFLDFEIIISILERYGDIRVYFWTGEFLKKN